MTRRGACSRRRLLAACGGLGAVSGAGCLRLVDDEQATGGETGADDASDRSTPATDGDEELDPEEFDVELVPAWDHTGAFGVATADGDFFVRAESLTRMRPDGTVVFDATFDDGYRATIDTGWGRPLVADASGVYVGARPSDDGDGGRLYAFEPETGRQRWVTEEPADGLHNYIRAVTRADDLVISASMSSGSGSDQEPIVRALDSDTGEERWRVDISEEFVVGLFAADDRLFVQRTFDTVVYDLETGTRRTDYQFGAGFQRAVRADDTLYVPGETVRAIALPSGDERWAVNTIRSVDTSAALGETGLFVGTESGYVLGYDRTTGDQLWETRIDGVVSHTPVVADGLVWVVSDRGDLSAFTATAGDLVYAESVEPGLSFAIQDRTLLDTGRETAFEIRRR